MLPVPVPIKGINSGLKVFSLSKLFSYCAEQIFDRLTSPKNTAHNPPQTMANEQHVRIDEGIKRGPRYPTKPVSTQLLQARPAATAIEHREEIIAKVAAGHLMRDIAIEYNVTPQAISQVLASDPEYQAAREQGIEQQLERWQAEITAASSSLSLARAREAFRASAWRGEREHPRRWGVKQEITHSVEPVLHLHVAAVPRSSVIADACTGTGVMSNDVLTPALPSSNAPDAPSVIDATRIDE